ncbi:MAG: hypothetical protein ACI4M6_03285 [Christensenellaceae bacterium]
MLVWQFLGEVLLEFFSGLLGIFISPTGGVGGILGGIFRMLNPVGYINILSRYKSGFNVGDWIIAVIGILLFIAMVVAIFFVAIKLVVKLYKRYFSKKTLDDDLIKEIARLKGEVRKVSRERDKALQGVGLIAVTDDRQAADNGNEASDENAKTGKERFYKLLEIDRLYSLNPPRKDFNDEVSLKDICDCFRAWACKERGLYYEERIIRLFVSALATTRLIILQGISGTGKTSLPYAMGQFLSNPSTIASVQPSWRDRTEIFGYFNEFTKRYNETEILKAMYEARWNDDLYLTVIDEANISRIEYYFAELLSVYELPSRDNWVVDLCSSGWDTDPVYVEKGRFRLPYNMWYVATINNDDSTFSVSDKVYDRAIPININTKGVFFEADEAKAQKLNVSNTHLEALFKEAQEKYRVSEENMKKFNDMDDYVIKHFRLAFGNRIVKQLKEFIPVFVACGGTEIDGLDYVLCNKILRKFESLNLSFIRDEIDGYIDYLNANFGEENMQESKEYLERLKKLF